MANFRRFWIKEPRHSETVSDENCHLYRNNRRPYRIALGNLPAVPSVFDALNIERGNFRAWAT